MRLVFVVTLFFIVYAAALWTYGVPAFEHAQKAPVTEEQIVAEAEKPTPTTVPLKNPHVRYVIPQGTFVAQSFNNCGPAALSMVLSMYGTSVSQDILREKMRPFSNPFGGVDDKSIFAPEFVRHAEYYGYKALERPNGDIELLKKLIANDIPVIVRTWLHPQEDIGHFRIVRGYDSTQQVIIQDDSYEGPNLTYSYDIFLSMWQPFNYGYILVYPKDRQAVVEAILGEEVDAKAAYANSIARAKEELQKNPNDSYAQFNLATAYHHLGDYQKSVEAYEKSVAGLPPRMLWYQIEPIYAYARLKNAERVFSLTDRILYNGNLAYSELYQIRGEMFLASGNREEARSEFEKAVYYNQFFEPAKASLRNLDEM